MVAEFIEFPRCYCRGLLLHASLRVVVLSSWKNKPTRRCVRCTHKPHDFALVISTTKSHLIELCCDALTGKILFNHNEKIREDDLRLLHMVPLTVISCMHYRIPLFRKSQISCACAQDAARKMQNRRSMTRPKARSKTPAQDQRCILSIIMSQRNVYSSAADLAIFFRRRCDGGAADTAYVYDEPGWPAVQHHVVDGRETNSGQTERRWYIGVVGPDRRRRRCRYRRDQQRHTDKRLSAVFQHPDDK